MAQSTGGSYCSRFCRPTDLGCEPVLHSAGQRHTTTGRSAVTTDGGPNKSRCPDWGSDQGEGSKARQLAVTSVRGSSRHLWVNADELEGSEAHCALIGLTEVKPRVGICGASMSVSRFAGVQFTSHPAAPKLDCHREGMRPRSKQSSSQPSTSPTSPFVLPQSSFC